MHSTVLLTALLAAFVNGQGEGLGYPPPPPEILSTTKSGVLPVLPTETPFNGVETLEGAIMEKGPPNPSYTPLHGPAPTQVNPAGATYQAVLPPTNYDNGTGSTVTGSITVSSNRLGDGVNVYVNFQGFPDMSMYGPFVYHIHALPVPANGDCTATLGHLDPQNGGEYYPCIPSSPENCQVGDLAGKYGAITTSPFITHYTDPFLSTVSDNPASVAGKSVVIHTSNTTRITCANFILTSTNTTGGLNGTMPSVSAQPMPSASVLPSNEASRVAGYGVAALLAAIAAFFM